VRKIILSKRASKKLDELLAYLEEEWSEKVKKEFIDKLDASFDQIKIYPASSIRSDVKKGLHKCVVTKQTSVYYLFDEKTIKVATIIDNRMDSDKLKKEIE